MQEFIHNFRKRSCTSIRDDYTTISNNDKIYAIIIYMHIFKNNIHTWPSFLNIDKPLTRITRIMVENFGLCQKIYH